MRKEDLRASFDRIRPDESAKKRMLGNILNQYERKKGIIMPFSLRKAIPALAIIVVVTGGLLTYNNLIVGKNNNLPYEYGIADNGDMAREDAIAPILNQFQTGNRHYVLLTDDLREDYGLPVLIDNNDIGEKITDITISPDPSLIGSEVYSYIPAGAEAIVAVKRNNEFQLFRFFTFESYNNNQDEDAVEYLKLYGINRAGDIAKIQFIRHTEHSKLRGYTDVIAEITDRDEITGFYSYYSMLENSSDQYFDSLFNFKGTSYEGIDVEIDPVMPDMAAPDRIGYGTDLPLDITPEQEGTAYDLPLIITEDGNNGFSPNDSPVSSGSSPSGSGMMDMGNTVLGSVEPSHGSVGDALANPITIRIYNQNGIYYDSPYYRNIGFISRYKVSDNFKEFIAKYLDE
ncbi:MAG: hypothetical protein GX213_13055 [Clostridiaceae bacterium]|nr:hypothetical protein [Clostridiaceae bacterium]